MIPFWPMLGSPAGTVNIASLPPDQWTFEQKVDGVRAVVAVANGRATLWSRTGSDLTATFPEVVASLSGGDRTFVLDGELQLVAQHERTATLADLLSRVNASRRVAAAARKHPAWLIAFDALSVEGTSLVGRPLTQRQDVLYEIVFGLDVPGLQLIESSGDGPAMLAETRLEGLEGVMAKRRSSLYLPGRRSTAWLKFKNIHVVRCVAFAITPGKGSRSFGALEVALLREGAPVPVATVGSGLSGVEMTALTDLLGSGQFPLVRVGCLGLSTGGRLRQPVFLGLLPDDDYDDAGFDQLATLPITT